MKIFYFLSVLAICAFAASCSEANKGANLTATNTVAINSSANTNTMAKADPSSTPAGDLMDGQALYKKNCAACHRDEGTGGKVTIEGKTLNPDNLTTDRKKAAPDDKFHAWIANGHEEEGMPAFKEKLTDEQITAIVKYIRTDLQKLPQQ